MECQAVQTYTVNLIYANYSIWDIKFSQTEWHLPYSPNKLLNSEFIKWNGISHFIIACNRRLAKRDDILG